MDTHSIALIIFTLWHMCRGFHFKSAALLALAGR